MDPSLNAPLREIVEHAYAHAPAVRRIFDEAGLVPADVQTTADLDKIPVTTKDRLIELQQLDPPFGGFLATPLASLQHVFLSPGPLYIPWAGDPSTLGTFEATSRISGVEPGAVLLNALAYHLVPVGLLVDTVARMLGGVVIPAGVGAADLQVKLLRELQVSFYVGTPSWLMALIQKAEEQGLDFRRDFALRRALVSAEPLPPSLRQTLVEKYGLQVTNVYGTAELGLLAYDQEGSLAMRLLESPIIQVVNPDSGQTVASGEAGQVVVTTFNKTFPLIRLGTGDLALNVDPAPGQSRQGDRSIILVGRVGDAVKVRGMFVHPNQLRFALAQTPGVVRAQAAVSRNDNRDELALRVVPAEGADLAQLSAALHNTIRSTCRIKVDRVEFVTAEALPPEAGVLVDERTWR